jgi:hypothetical protein
MIERRGVDQSWILRGGANGLLGPFLPYLNGGGVFEWYRELIDPFVESDNSLEDNSKPFVATGFLFGVVSG